MIARAGQLWYSLTTDTYRYIVHSYEGFWCDATPCTWHDYINLDDGSAGRAREKDDGGWETRGYWWREL